jgi:tetrapyrrole methylase family protein/MazG family protein
MEQCMTAAGEQFEKLLEIMATLRGPHGCPWDKEQTHASICPSFLEELHEFIEAVEDDDIEAMREELGDLCLHIAFQAQVARERGEFEMAGVLAGINEKLVRRHPHVFGTQQLDTPEAVLRNWEHIKKAEKKHSARTSVVDGIPRNLPALSKAHKLQKKVRKVGFDWQHIEDVLAKVDEELAELRAALAGGATDHVREEIGDLLFSVVNVARFVDVDAERALHQTVRKFMRRFRALEDDFAARGAKLDGATLAELDAVWNQVKARERAG